MEEIKKIIQEPVNGQLLRAAERYQNRVRMHCDTEDEKPNENEAFIYFLSWIKRQVILEKFDLIQSLIQTPLATNRLTGQINKNYKKIFQGANSFKEIVFATDSIQEDYKSYEKELEKEIEDIFYESYSTYPCDFIIATVGEKYKLSRIDICSVHDCVLDKSGFVEYILYKKDKEYYWLVNKEGYYLVDQDGNKIEEYIHGLGYTPVFSPLLKAINNNKFKKEVPVSNELGDLDVLLKKKVMREFVELYGEAPIIASYEDDNTYEDEGYTDEPLLDTENSSGDHNYDEYLHWKTNGHREPQKEDSKNALLFAGAQVRLKVPKGDESIVTTPVQFINPSTDNLNYTKDAIREREDEIYISATGSLPEFRNNEALNQDQVASQYEQSYTNLIFYKEQLEIFERSIVICISDLMYGVGSIKSITIDRGSKFYLKDIRQIREDIQASKDSGLNESFVSAEYEELIETKYKNNPDAKIRALMLFYLEPFNTRSMTEVQEMVKTDPSLMDDFRFKAKFNKVVTDFENKFMPIETFGLERLQFVEESLKSIFEEKYSIKDQVIN